MGVKHRRLKNVRLQGVVRKRPAAPPHDQSEPEAAGLKLLKEVGHV